MSSHSKWPDFRLASTISNLVGWSSSGPEKPTSSDSASPPQNHDHQQQELPFGERDDQRDGSRRASPAMMDSEMQSIEGVGSFDNFEHDAQVEDVGDNDEADFGPLEMFDSNATDPPYASQINEAEFDNASKAPEAVMDDAPLSSHKKSKRDKKDRKKKGTPQESESPQLTAEDEPSHKKSKKSKRKSGQLAEIADSFIASTQDQEPSPDADVVSSGEVVEASSQAKRKRKSSDAAEGRRKKRRPHDDVIDASQDVVQATASLEESAADTMDVDAHNDAQTPPGDSADKDLGTDLEAAIESENASHTGGHDVESLAREAWNEHINGQTQVETDVYDVPGSPIEAPNPPSSNPKRARSTRPKKAKPTYFEKSPSPEKDGTYGEPSPTAKPRGRAKKGTRKRKAEPADMGYGAQEDVVGSTQRKSRMGEFTQGRFTDNELSRIAMAVESFRSEHEMSQHQVNEMIHAPGGTTAGDEHAALWTRVFATCPDRHRQKIINITRKKFHNFVARGTWTAEQDAELRDLIEVHGTKWAKIAGIINRHPEDLRDRYRNYIVCGDAQRKDAWDELEEANLTQYVMEAMGAIDELRRIQPSRELLKKPYEELIDWQNISERMQRTRSRLQCITKWKAMNLKIHGKDKLVSRQPDTKMDFRLEKARRQIAEMPETERYRLVLAIYASAALDDSKIPWQKLVNTLFRQKHHRHTQMLLWRRLKQCVVDWEKKTVLDCAEYLVDYYNQSSATLPDISDENYDIDDEMEYLGSIPGGHSIAGHSVGGNMISDEYVGNSDVEDQVEDEPMMDIEQVGVPDENIQPDLPIEPMESMEAADALIQAAMEAQMEAQMEAPMEEAPMEEALMEEIPMEEAPMEAIQPDLPVEPVESPEEEDEPEPMEPAPPKATRSAKRSAPGKGRAPRRSAPPKPPASAKKRASRRAAPSQDPIEDDEVFLTQPPSTAENNSEIDEARPRKRKTPGRFRAVNKADGDAKSDGSDSLMDDMEDLPARVKA